MKKILVALIICTIVFLVYNEGPGERLELEGLYLDYNIRDVGESINACSLQVLGQNQKLMAPGHVLRSNKWFSGWDCEHIDNPDAIVTLNYHPEKRHKYYCRNSSGRIVGKIPLQTKEIKNIEWVYNWDIPDEQRQYCAAVKTVFDTIASNKKTLFHCEAGRDRTGAFAALVAGLVLERQENFSRQQITDLVECDYRKSESLKVHKHGWMERFFNQIWDRNDSIAEFLVQQCEVSPEQLDRIVGNLTPQS